VTNVDDREASHRSAFAHRTGPGGARISPTSAANQEGWPPNEANVLEPATWRLELLIAGDNIRAERTFVTVTFDGTWPDPEGSAIWEHFVVHGPSPEISAALR
jgi:hypothetical protein